MERRGEHVQVRRRRGQSHRAGHGDGSDAADPGAAAEPEVPEG